MTVEIHELQTYEAMVEVGRVQRAIWRFSDATGFYPPSLLAFAHNGGLVLGAYDVEGSRMIGFCVGFLARHGDGQLKLYSQAMGILPEYRHSGLAVQLKRRQREWALAQGLTLITWTYDPLEMPNARLNITKLGGLVRRYRRNLYGEQFGQLNAGLPTDRFVVEWRLDSARVEGCLAGTLTVDLTGAQPVTEVAGKGEASELVRYDAGATAGVVSAEMLNDLQATKTRSLELARDWRMKTRALFEAYFERGYAVTGFVTQGRGRDRRNWYILSDRDWAVGPPAGAS